MFIVFTCPRRILNLPPLILFGCQNLNIFGDPFFRNWNFSHSSGPLYALKNFFLSQKFFPPWNFFFRKNILYHYKLLCNISYTIFHILLAKCYATDGPNQKSHKCMRECFNDYDWLHYDVEDDKVWCFDCTNASRHGTHCTVYRTLERRMHSIK